MAPRANWKGFLRLSLVTCPVALYPATSESERSPLTSLTGRQAIESNTPKRAGKSIAAKARPRGENVVDLMDALRKSIGGVAATAAEPPKKAAKKPRKAAAGQKEMLMPIAGKKPKEAAAKKSASKPQRKSA
jgi:non-homologous end joining protein Ku